MVPALTTDLLAGAAGTKESSPKPEPPGAT